MLQEATFAITNTISGFSGSELARGRRRAEEEVDPRTLEDGFGSLEEDGAARLTQQLSVAARQQRATGAERALRSALAGVARSAEQ